MEPLIRSGQLVVVQPITSAYAFKKGDVVLCTVGRHQYLHRVLQIDAGRGLVLIGNMRGRQNGWTPFGSVHGRLTEVLP